MDCTLENVSVVSVDTFVTVDSVDSVDTVDTVDSIDSVLVHLFKQIQIYSINFLIIA